MKRSRRPKRCSYPVFSEEVASKHNINKFYLDLRQANMAYEDKADIIRSVPILPEFKVEELVSCFKVANAYITTTQRLKEWERLATDFGLPDLNQNETSSDFSFILEKATNDAVVENRNVVEVLVTSFYSQNYRMLTAVNDSHITDKLKVPEPVTMLIGPTGSGKTHTIRAIAKLFPDLNVVYLNAAAFVRSGIVGESIDSIPKRIFDQCRDKLRADFSVIILDEFDKLLSNEKQVLTQLLTAFEGVPINIPRDSSRDASEYPPSINTENLWFVLLGSFEIYQDRNKSSIGFTSENEGYEVNDIILTENQMPPELQGRIGRVLAMSSHKFSDHEYISILTRSENSPLVRLKKQLKLFGHELTFESDSFLSLVKRANVEKLGVRAVFQEFEKLDQPKQLRMEALKATSPSTFELIV